jgi:tetratricopeptide (TPR) repeat protein
VGLFILFTVIGTLASRDPKVQNLASPAHIFTSLVILSLVATAAFYASRVVLAESHIRQAQVAISNNDGKILYDESQKAVTLVPNMISYHLSYSQINFSLANALSQKDSLTDEDRNNVSTLVSQAIREGKTALSLSPNNSSVWLNLGSIYQNLINVADGADKYAIEAYTQAIALDPASPTLRVQLGGLLYQLGQSTKDPVDKNTLFARAQSEFQTAIQLKPDYPNAYYNLAKLLESAKDYANSAAVMQKAISLLGPNNPDLVKANTELESIKKFIPKSSPSKSPNDPPVASSDPETTISEPSPLPSPIDGGPLEIDITP